ncbi:MAG TPA: hypothetical protein PLA50_00950 [Bacteroidia bacterium]|nr:hypothetical protein [Bacteroidia bacterium]
MEERPLFIPLKREFFDAFERREKHEEYRRLGPCWNAETCRPGRAVTLSLGYGRRRRLSGRIASFHVEPRPAETLPGWSKCYGKAAGPAAVIGIELDR